MAPLEVIEKVSELSGKPVGWFYFGEIEAYIQAYLLKRRQGALLKKHTEISVEIKKEFLTGDFKNPGWENDFGYPVEEFIDDCYADIHVNLLREYIQKMTEAYLEKKSDLRERVDAGILITAEAMSYYEATGEFDYGDNEKIMALIEECYQRIAKKQEVTFDEHYLVGKLINILADEEETEKLILELSSELTGKHFSSFFGGEELIHAFQSFRPELMKIYVKTDFDDYYDWFEKKCK